MTIKTSDEGTCYCIQCEAYARTLERVQKRLKAAELCARYLDAIPESQRAPVENEALMAWHILAEK